MPEDSGHFYYHCSVSLAVLRELEISHLDWNSYMILTHICESPKLGTAEGRLCLRAHQTSAVR